MIGFDSFIFHLWFILPARFISTIQQLHSIILLARAHRPQHVLYVQNKWTNTKWKPHSPSAAKVDVKDRSGCVFFGCGLDVCCHPQAVWNNWTDKRSVLFLSWARSMRTVVLLQPLFRDSDQILYSLASLHKLWLISRTPTLVSHVGVINIDCHFHRLEVKHVSRWRLTSAVAAVQHGKKSFPATTSFLSIISKIPWLYLPIFSPVCFHLTTSIYGI